MGTDTKERGAHLRYLRKQAGFASAGDLGEAIGRAPETVRAYESGNRNFPMEVAKKLAKLLGVSVDVLYYGKQFNQADINTAESSIGALAPIRIPLIEWRNIEQFRSISSGAKPMSETTIFASKVNSSRRIFAVKMPDASMEAGDRKAIFKGEPVIIDCDSDYSSGHIVAALASGFDGAIIRKYRVKAHGDDGNPLFDLVPLNSDYPSVIDAHTKNVTILGRAIQVMRDL